MTEKDFRILEDYVLPPKAPPPSDDFYKYVKPSRDEIDAKLEYDMDEEDFAWLELFNEQRAKTNLSQISFDSFEFLMDQFEKESFFHCTSKNFKPVPPELEHQADCAVCLDGTSSEENAILFCDMCSLSVHQKCYGVIKVPEEIWLCKRCLYSPAATANCCLCSCKSGALKRSLDGKWAHIVCAFWIPEVNFGSDRSREPVMGMDTIPSMRWKLTCFVCNQKGKGACLQCHHSNCLTAYHASCAQLVGLTMKMETFIDTDGVSKKKVTTFCEVHSTQLIDDFLPNNDLKEYEGPKYLSSDDSEDDINQTSGRAPNSVLQDSNKSKKNVSWKSRLKLARKILAAWIEMEQPIFVPVVTVATINKITKKARELEIEKHESFVTRLHSYWTLKRQSRDGYPLLNSRKFGENIKILNVNVHLSPGSFQHHPSNEKLSNSTPIPQALSSPLSPTFGNVDMESFSKGNDIQNAVLVANECVNGDDYEDEDGDDDNSDESFTLHLMFCQRLRQDLEKVRLLIELVRKRERLKLEQIKLYEKQIALQLCPDYHTIKLILDEIMLVADGMFDKYEGASKFMESLQSNLEGRIYFNLNDFLVDLKHLFALCPPILADKINEKVSRVSSLVTFKRTADGSSHHFQESTLPISSHTSSSMLVGNNSNKAKTKKRKSATEGASGSSKMKFHVTTEQGQRGLKTMKHTLIKDYCQAKKQKLANKNQLSEKSFSDQIVNESIPKERESFKTYRLTISPKTDEYGDEKDKAIETKKSGLSSAESGSCYDDNDGQETSEDEEEGSLIDFKPFDLVWAKYHGILWHPAMVMSLSRPPPSFLPIQLPEIPREAVEILLIKPLLRLVVFLDDKSTWKCIPLNKLLPLGTNPAIDKWKLLDSKKMSTRKVIQTAYDKALQYQQSELSLVPKEKNLENDSCNKGSKIEEDQNPNMILLKEQKQYQLELLKLQQQLSQQIISEAISQDSSFETLSSKSPVVLGFGLSTNHDVRDKQYGTASPPAMRGNTTHEDTHES